jgi:hypothetical protein
MYVQVVSTRSPALWPLLLPAAAKPIWGGDLLPRAPDTLVAPAAGSAPVP